MMTHSPRVVVVMGGPSEEHEVSLRSGQGVVQALTRRQWMAEPLVIPRTSGVAEALASARRGLMQAQAELVFIALHGPFGEDGTIQQLCEELHLPYTGSDVLASRLGMDKVASKRRFEEAGLRVPRWGIVEGPATSLPRELESLPYPVVVKPSRSGSSFGVSIVKDVTALPTAIAEAAHYGSPVIVEAFIAGRELTVGILGETALPVVEIRPRSGFFDYRAKYTQGATEYLVPAPVSADVAAAVQAVGLAAHRALGCRHLSRADLILDANHRPVLLEVNTIPGFTPTSLLPKAAACLQLSYDALCERLVMMASHEAVAVANR